MKRSRKKATNRKYPFKRYIIVDVMRGLAVLLMIFYHLIFDLNSFRLIRIDILGHPFWYGLPRFIVTIFHCCPVKIFQVGNNLL